MPRIAVAQVCSSSNLKENLGVVKELTLRAIDCRASIIFFPEATDYLASNFSHSRKLVRQSVCFLNELRTFLRELCSSKKAKIDISIGMHMPSQENTPEDDRVRNVLIYINSNGDIVDEYQKLHLFDVQVHQGPTFMESLSVQPGNLFPSLIETPVGKLGPAICYDIRFPEHALKQRELGADLICYPSAFTTKTGEAHWEVLARARAIDTQCFIIMPAQFGVHDIRDAECIPGSINSKHEVRESWGHSMVINPWGTVIARADDEALENQIITAEIDHELLHKVRENMPLWNQRRSDIF